MGAGPRAEIKSAEIPASTGTSFLSGIGKGEVYQVGMWEENHVFYNSIFSKIMQIAIAGTGYVGLSLAVLLAQRHEVMAVDVVPEKVEKINKRISPIQDEYIERFLDDARNDRLQLCLEATLDGKAAYRYADFVVIAAPTNYDPQKNFFDTSHVEEVVELVLEVNPDAVMVIKSTVPVGYTRGLQAKYPAGKFLFSPEFLRESKALYDNLYPSRIIVGSDEISPRASLGRDDNVVISTGAEKSPFVISTGAEKSPAMAFANLLKEAALNEPPVLLMGTTEAEAVKLFANTYLALRVSYFN